MHVVLDVSRLLFSVRRAAPSGIDRVEMAYAKRWLSRPAAECAFAAQGPAGGFASVPRPAVAALLDAVEAAWDGGVLIVGLNPLRPVDDGYVPFLELLAGQIASQLATYGNIYASTNVEECGILLLPEEVTYGRDGIAALQQILDRAKDGVKIGVLQAHSTFASNLRDFVLLF